MSLAVGLTDPGYSQRFASWKEEKMGETDIKHVLQKGWYLHNKAAQAATPYLTNAFDPKSHHSAK